MGATPIKDSIAAMLEQLANLRQALVRVSDDMPPTSERLAELAAGLAEWRTKARKLEIERNQQSARLVQIEEQLQEIQDRL
jgi:chromosome segregation ATPase